MSINIDQYLNAIPTSLEFNKESLISILEFSPNFKYNTKLDTIELRTPASKNILEIELKDSEKKQELVPSKEDIVEIITSEFSKNLLKITYSDKIAVIEFDSESICLSMEKKFMSLNIKAVSKQENIKEKIINNTHSLIRNKTYKPRKFSDNPNNKFNINANNQPRDNMGFNRQGMNNNSNQYGDLAGKPIKSNHKDSVSSKNKFDLINQNFGSSYRKNSYNKFDAYQVLPSQTGLAKEFELKNFPKSSYYTFKELSGLYWNMKLNKKLEFPKELEKMTDIEGVFIANGKENLEHFKSETNKMYRERANTELFQFKSKL